MASIVVEEPIDSEAQNTLETNIMSEEKEFEQPTDTFDSFFKDFEVEEHENDKCNPTTAESSVQYTVQPSVQSQNTKQSLFIRLANRIKVYYKHFLFFILYINILNFILNCVFQDLERNMSLSGEYLQELSTRYKKQVDDMQRTILELAEENRLIREQDLKILGEMKILSGQVASLQSSLHCLKAETENLNLVICLIFSFDYFNY